MSVSELERESELEQPAGMTDWTTICTCDEDEAEDAELSMWMRSRMRTRTRTRLRLSIDVEVGNDAAIAAVVRDNKTQIGEWTD